jgi:hypothetical protein
VSKEKENDDTLHICNKVIQRKCDYKGICTHAKLHSGISKTLGGKTYMGCERPFCMDYTDCACVPITDPAELAVMRILYGRTKE